MILKFHPGLGERWPKFSWYQKILNIGAELSRAKSAIRDNANDLADGAIERALELVDLTTECGAPDKSPFFMKEWLRFREYLASFYHSEKKDEREWNLLFRTFLELDPSVHNVGIQI